MTSRIGTTRRSCRVALVSASFLLAVGALAPSVLASSRSPELGFDFGVTDLTDNGDNDSGTRFALRGAYPFTPRFALEAQASRTEADDHGLEARLNTVFVNGLVRFRPDTRVEPYLLGGVGRANLKLAASGAGSVDDGGAAFQVGAGSQFFFDDRRRVGVRVEVARLRERTFDESTDYNNVATGVTWRLGRR